LDLETYNFPNTLIDVLSTIPQDQFHKGEHQKVVKYLLSMELIRPDSICRKPLIFRLDNNQLNWFQESMSEPTPEVVVPLSSQTVGRFDLLQLILACSIGEPLSISSVRKGAIIQDIFPTDSNRLTASSSYGSEKEFTFHNDLSFLEEPEIPEYVTLACLRNNEGAGTLVANIDQVLEHLDPIFLIELRKPQYTFRHSFDRTFFTRQERVRQRAILLPNNEISLGVDTVTMTDKSQEALLRLRILLTELSTSHILQPGEILILPNKTSVHSRTTFTMSSDKESRRWLQRINIGSAKLKV
jgi:hypothetical protein